jgi:hypothetical protein
MCGLLRLVLSFEIFYCPVTMQYTAENLKFLFYIDFLAIYSNKN